ncbi:hypothetical protein [Actinospongicola halichondriae]|uniref:hypothetical protein n=1 Tax=Actinospongicola halichondriae TaxID=3236844 RepID=UPI003D561586
MIADARRRGDRGQVAGIEVLPFGLLVFITGALLLTNIWGVVDAKFAADAAAREATRYVVESARSDVDVATIRAGATDVALQTLDDHGRPGPADVVLRPDAAVLTRCQRIEVTVSTEVPAVRIPFIGGFGRPFAIVATHSELIDPTRSGVDGRADCIR